MRYRVEVSTTILHSLKVYDTEPVAYGERGVVSGHSVQAANQKIEVTFDVGGMRDVFLESISRSQPVC